MKKYLDNKLIVIDDSAFARVAISSLLKKIGFKNIDLPEDSAEAWELIAQSLVGGEPYDLIMTDLNMPGIDGIELISKIKSDPMSKDLKIIVISADGDELMMKKTQSLGVLGYLVKPVDQKELESVLKKVI